MVLVVMDPVHASRLSSWAGAPHWRLVQDTEHQGEAESSGEGEEQPLQPPGEGGGHLHGHLPVQRWELALVSNVVR